MKLLICALVLLFAVQIAKAADSCGRNMGGKLCPSNSCCSISGFCGSSAAECGIGCQSGACAAIPGVDTSGLKPAVADKISSTSSSAAVSSAQSSVTSSSSAATTSSSQSSASAAAITTTTKTSTSSSSTSTSTAKPATTSEASIASVKCQDVSCLSVMTPMKDELGQYMSCARVGAIAMTYDDGPHPTYSDFIINAFKARNFLTSFFVVGTQVVANPSILRNMHSAGNQICLHSMRHNSLADMTVSQIASDLSENENAVYSVIKKYPNCIRCPFGAITKEGATYIQSLGYRMFYWNLDSEDWVHSNTNTILQYYKTNITSENVKQQSFISLQHDINLASKNVVSTLLDWVIGIGLVPMPASTCINDNVWYKNSKMVV